jgi:hypothetical protein
MLTDKLLYHTRYISSVLSVIQMSKESLLHGHVVLESCQPPTRDNVDLFLITEKGKMKRRGQTQFLKKLFLTSSCMLLLYGNAMTLTLLEMYLL